MKQLLLCLLFSVPAFADGQQRIQVNLSDEQLAKMPRWGKITASKPLPIAADRCRHGLAIYG